MDSVMNKQWIYAELDEIPPCDFCNMPAHVDAATSLTGNPWAYMCFKHWEIKGYYKRLGMGIGQLLIPYGSEMENYSSADIEHLRNMAERYDQPMFKGDGLHPFALFGD